MIVKQFNCKNIPVHAIEEYDSEGAIPLVLKPGNRWGLVVMFMLLVGK
jgi:hypothetical protein